MKKRTIWIILAVIAGGIILFALVQRQQGNRQQRTVAAHASNATSGSTSESPKSSEAARVPAHYETAPSRSSLGSTLPPERFTGKARDAYQVSREIPEVLAQLPCYCHCDMSLGHKSLHSCFEDNHAANCATCISEALTADALKKQGLSAAQIREAIIAQYSD